LFLLIKPTGGKLWRWKYRLQWQLPSAAPDSWQATQVTDRTDKLSGRKVSNLSRTPRLMANYRLV